MVNEYKGHFGYTKLSIVVNSPDEIGIYYMGILNSNGSLGVLNVGRAMGEQVTIKSRLLSHINSGEWPDITHFGFRVCSIPQEVEDLEKEETVRLGIPKYNKRIG